MRANVMRANANILPCRTVPADENFLWNVIDEDEKNHTAIFFKSRILDHLGHLYMPDSIDIPRKDACKGRVEEEKVEARPQIIKSLNHDGSQMWADKVVTHGSVCSEHAGMYGHAGREWPSFMSAYKPCMVKT
ncbi:hypothetical protein TNCV_4511111 [Trichonephila clavipes]|nr:hypothetical protein TNCV_4511111 [Trichonephila clavipes]